MDVLLIIISFIILGQVGPSWGDVFEIAKPVIIALLTLFAVKFMTPSFNRNDDEVKRLEERIKKGEEERKDLVKENNGLWKLYNEMNTELQLLKQKQFDHNQWIANEFANTYKTVGRVDNRIDDFRTFLTKKNG